MPYMHPVAKNGKTKVRGGLAQAHRIKVSKDHRMEAQRDACCPGSDKIPLGKK